MPKKIIIIGAGVAGLSAGCYARMNGYAADIYELHNKAGGLCTSWKRGGYTIDGGVHWIVGIAPGNSFYQFWEELGALKDIKIVYHETFFRMKGEDGRTLCLYCDVDKLERHLIELSPEDAHLSRQFCSMIRKVAEMFIPMDKASELLSIFDYLKMMKLIFPYINILKYINNITVLDYANQFKDPLLRDGLKNICDEKYSLSAIIFAMSFFHNKTAGYPIGGSLKFAQSIEERFYSIGGKIYYNNRVTAIIVEQGKAVGIVLENNNKVYADYIISAGDLYSTIHDLLGNKYRSPIHEMLFREIPTLSSFIQVSFGVNMDFAKEASNHVQFFKPFTTIRIEDKPVNYMNLTTYGFDPTLAPECKTVMTVTYATDNYELWEELYKDKVAYKNEKERILQATINELNHLYPGFKDKIEVSDIATPVTYYRYTSNWKGKFMTWIETRENSKKLRMIKKTIPGVKNLYLSGKWLMPPGGLGTGAKTSRDIIQVICKADKNKFKATPL